MRLPGMPVFNNDERLALVRACKWVDEVTDSGLDPCLHMGA